MKLNVKTRELTGKKVKQLRRQNIIPAVIYGKTTKEATSLSCEKNEFLKIFKKSGYSTPITVIGDGIEQLALIHDVQVDPVTDFLSHIDFLAVSMDEKVVASIPVLLIGQSNIEKLGEGKVQLLKDTIEVEAFPQDLPHDIKIDISVIQKMSDVIFVKDLDVGTKAEIVEDLEQAVVTVVTFAEEIEETPVVESVEGVEGEKKEDSEEDKKEGSEEGKKE